jgi:hypothetical protein
MINFILIPSTGSMSPIRKQNQITGKAGKAPSISIQEFRPAFPYEKPDLNRLKPPDLNAGFFTIEALLAILQVLKGYGTSF